MKKLLLTLSTLLSFNAFSGTAIINNWQVDPSGFSCFRVSNTSNVNADVKFTLYKGDGQEYTGALRATSLISSLNTPFVVPPKNTAYFCLETISGVEVGYGVIEGKASAPHTGEVKLVAHGQYAEVLSNTRFGYTIDINGGQPF